MKNLFLVSVFFLFAFTSFGQFKEFDLSNQQLGDFQFQGLDFSFLFNGYNSNSKFEDIESDYSQFSTNANVVYNNIINNRKTQLSHSAEVKFRGDYFKSDDFEGQVSDNVSRIDIENDIVKRFYQNNNVFFGIGNELDFTYQTQKSETMNVVERDFNTHNFKVGVPLSIGIGRLENVTDSWRAYRTFEDLQKFGVLERLPTDEEITSLAKLNTLRKNWRFFDSRFKRIEDIKILATHFLEAGFVKEENHFFYNSIFDTWAFGTNGLRRSGKRLELIIAPSYQNLSFINSRSSKVNQNEIILSFSPTYSFYKPINLKWQWDLQTGLENNYIAFNSENLRHQITNVFISNQVGYFPTSRTAIRGNLFVSAATPYLKPLGESDPLVQRFNINTSINVDYYISPQTRINVTAFYGNTNNFNLSGDNILQNSRRNILSFRLGFSHAFF